MSGQMENDEWILATLEKAMEKGRDVLCEGAVANYIPELAKANPSNLGVCIRTSDALYHAEYFKDLFADTCSADCRL